ncbi:unnamed protein product [marine sediment metagenome]|uniref:Uncharacterized protein n=1 Tax=marine sediment metagenome TaxID=412755 RepID=X1R8U8_9ZZZZ
MTVAIDKENKTSVLNSQEEDYQVAGRPLFVKLFPELSAAALKAGLDKELALWYELRAINITGCGRLLLNDALAGLVSSFGYTQATAYRLLQAGDGKLWDIKDPPPTQSGSTPSGSDALSDSSASSYRLLRTPAVGLPVVKGVPKPTAPFSGGQNDYSTALPSRVIKIYRLYRVAEWFNIWVGRPVEVPASDFRGRQAKTAWLYASFFKPDGSRAKPISRDSIEAATGVKRRQQQRYDKVAGIKRVVNFAFWQDSQGKLVPWFKTVFSFCKKTGKCKQWQKYRRLGNSYHSRALKAPRGMTKRVNAELQRSFNQDEARLPKRFFLTPGSLIRSSVRDNEAFLLVNKRDRLIKGRMEWCMT